MLKVLGRILIILLITVVIAAAIYFIAQNVMGMNTLPSGGEFSGNGPGSGLHDGGGNGPGGGGDREGSISGTSWLGIIKELATIALATIVIALVRGVAIKTPARETAETN